MDKREFQLEIRIAWWFTYGYLPVTAFLSELTGLPPDPDKLEFWIRRAVKAKVARNA